MDAVIDYCKNNDIDVGTINSMVNKSLKEKIKAEAINLKMIKEKKGGTYLYERIRVSLSFIICRS